MRKVLWLGWLIAVGCGGDGGGGELTEEEFQERVRAGICTWVEACASTVFTSYYTGAEDCEANLITSFGEACTFDPVAAQACLDLLEGEDCEAEAWVPDGETCSASYVCQT